LFPTSSSLFRISPIGYFYSKYSYLKRIEIIEDCVKRMFGKQNTVEYKQIFSYVSHKQFNKYSIEFLSSSSSNLYNFTFSSDENKNKFLF
jgi:hypothetical protein